jgi:hypothetical protein
MAAIRINTIKMRKNNLGLRAVVCVLATIASGYDEKSKVSG